MVLFCLNGNSQAQAVSGQVQDTFAKKPLINAVVSLLQKDSTLIGFSRTDKKGRFLIESSKNGKFILLVTYPGFADFAEEITIHQETNHNLGSIAMTLKAKLLDAVIIRSAGAIRIKGDTTEFVADSFLVREGATVEELLKKLPGFQVNSKGEITAQGQRVQKVLVDGEEFFGDDPTMATKNLSARSVDKVQVFDNKTEQQNLTGISSGTEGKTVNIKLKEDQKKGSFGKIEAGSNLNDLVDAKILFNRFKGKKKLSFFGTRTNTSTGSLNWDERRKLGIENDMEYDEISGFYYSFGTSDEFSSWNFRGIPDAWSAGALFIDKWNEDKHGINASYRFNRLGTANLTARLIQSLTPERYFTTNTTTRTSGINQQHAGNFKYEWKFDSLRSVKLTTAGTYKTTGSSNLINDETENPSLNKRTTNNRFNNQESTKKQLDNQLQYKQMFKKKNRLFMATVRLGYIEDDQQGFVYSNVNYFTGTTLDSTQIQDQQKINSGTSTTLGTKLTFSEPIGTKWTVIADLSHNRNFSSSFKNTFDTSFSGKYEILNPLFSNNFDLEAFSNSGTLIGRYQYKKFRFAAGSGLSSIKLNLHNLDDNKQTVYRFTNLTPQASINYAIKMQTNLGLNYRGTNLQPSINQLQPLRDNNDPLNIYVGNPDLEVGFNHNLSLFFNSYKILSARGIWANAGVTISENAITQFSNINEQTGARTYRPVNVEGVHNWYIWSEWNKGQGDKVFIHTINFNGNGGRNISFVNSERNVNNYIMLELGYGIRYEAEEKYKLFLSPKFGINNSESSLYPTQENKYYHYGGNAEVFVMLPGKIEFTTDVDVELRERIPVFQANPNIILWNGMLSKRFLKEKNARVMLIANDILDQNRGFTRIINNDRLTEENFQRIARYFMIKLEWSFNKMGGN